MDIAKHRDALYKTTRSFAGRDVEVILEGFEPRVGYVDGVPKTIYLPAIPDNAPVDLLEACHGLLDHECGHVLHSDGEDICNVSKSKLWHYLHNCIDDPRVNKLQMQIYPGTQNNLQAAYDYIFKKMPMYQKSQIDLAIASKPIEDLQYSYAPMWFGYKQNCILSSEKYNELGLDRIFSSFEEKVDQFYLDLLAALSTTESVNILADYFEPFFQLPPESGEGKGNGTQDKDGNGDSSSKEGEAKEEDGTSKQPSLGQTIDEQMAKLISDEIQELTKKSKANIYWTDRFDRFIDKYEMAKAANNNGFQEFENETRLITYKLIKDMRIMMEERRRRFYTGGYQSGKLHTKHLYSAKLGNTAVFKRKNEIRDVNAAVSLLIDLSGSMGGKKIEVAMQSAYAFAMCLEQLQIPYEVFGFNTSTVAPEVQVAFKEYAKTIDPKLLSKIVSTSTYECIHAFKKFDDKFDKTSKLAMYAAYRERIDLVENEDSKHVRLALERLHVRPEKVKSLFVFSDGFPCFPCHNGHKNSQINLKYYISNAKEQYGVDVYGIGISSASVYKFYDKNQNVNNINELPKVLFNFLKKSFD